LANLADQRHGARDGSRFTAEIEAYEDGENLWNLRNLIGNVSEWTATLSERRDARRATVVGGSFAEPWGKSGFQWQQAVGFRCVVIPNRNN
jgi:formylglycine-generating enzyme required for sulfatase activity